MGVSYATGKILSGQSLSAAVELHGLLPTAVVMPSGWDAADLTFQGSVDGVSYVNLFDGLGAAGNEIVVRTAASRYVLVDPYQFYGMLYIKIRSGTSGTGVNQTADRVLIVPTRSI